MRAMLAIFRRAARRYAIAAAPFFDARHAAIAMVVYAITRCDGAMRATRRRDDAALPLPCYTIRCYAFADAICRDELMPLPLHAMFFLRFMPLLTPLP